MAKYAAAVFIRPLKWDSNSEITNKPRILIDKNASLNKNGQLIVTIRMDFCVCVLVLWNFNSTNQMHA